jgi:hypothetical protein
MSFHVSDTFKNYNLIISKGWETREIPSPPPLPINMGKISIPMIMTPR